MSDSEFLGALHEERHQKQAELDDANQRLGQAREQKAVTLDAYHSYRDPSGMVRGVTMVRGAPTEREHELHEAMTAANQLVYDLEQTAVRATAHLKEIDRLLDAEDDFTRGREAVRAVDGKLADTRATIAQLQDIEQSLQREQEELKAQRGKLLAEHGRPDVAARIAGKSVAAPKAIAALDADLESRGAAHAASQSARAEHEAALATLTEQRQEINRRLEYALMRRAELDVFEKQPSISQVYARLFVTGSDLAYSSRPNVFEAHYSDDDIKEAQAWLEQQMCGDAT